MSTRIDKGGPKFKPVLKSKARPSATPTPQDARPRHLIDPSASMPPPSSVPERMPPVTPMPRAPSTTPTSDPLSTSNTISTTPSAAHTQPPRATPIVVQSPKPQNAGNIISLPSARPTPSSGTLMEPSRVTPVGVQSASSSTAPTAVTLPSATPSAPPSTPVASTSRISPMIAPSRVEPGAGSRFTPPPSSTPGPTLAPLSTSKGKKRAALEMEDAGTAENEHSGAQSADERGVARKRPKLAIVQAEADRVIRPRRAKANRNVVIPDAEDETSGEEGSEFEAPQKTTRAKRKKSANENTTTGDSDSHSKPTRTRAKRKRTSDADTSIPEAPDTGNSQSESEAPAKKKKRRRRATTTPAEEPEGMPEPIDPTQVTMGAICDDTGSGRVSSRWETSQVHYADARKRAKEERARAILEAQEEERETGRTTARKGMPRPVLPSEKEAAGGEESVVENTGGDPDEYTYNESLKASHYAPQVRIGANGEVVLDMESLQVDRAADPEIAEDAYSFVEESDQTKFTNSNSWSKRRSVRWGKEDTALFYDALRQFGQNFDLIARVLPGRTYKMCKNKFKAEDKKNPGLIDDALKNGVAVDLAALSRLTGKDFSGPTPIIEARKALDLREDEDPAERATTVNDDESGARKESQTPGLDGHENPSEENDKEPDTRQSASPPPAETLLGTINTDRQSASPPPPEALLGIVARPSLDPTPSRDAPATIAAPSRAAVPVAISTPARQPLTKEVPVTASTAPVQVAAETSVSRRKKGKKKAAQEEGVEILGLVDDHVEN